jgi:LacI family transcriptional regulator
MKKRQIRDVAKILGVSIATISRAINNRYGISRATRERILAKLEEISYQPNFVAKSLSLRKTSTIGVVIPGIEYPFFPEIVMGMERVASRANYQIILCHSNEDLEKEGKEIQVLLNKRVDGLIVAPVQGKGGAKMFRDVLMKDSVPFVLITRYFKTIPTHYVGCDDRMGAHLAAQHLLKLGHKRIACILDRYEISPCHDRLAGYKDALREHGEPFKGELVTKAMRTLEGGHQAMRNLLVMEPPPTAVFCMNDMVAVGALRAVEEHNLKVPDDISLVGFDDVFWASLIEPPLTTVFQPKREIGEKAAELLLEEMERRESVAPRTRKPARLFLEPALVVRESTMAVKNKPGV